MELGIDPTLPSVPVSLKGKTYHLCFGFNAICRVYTELGINMLEAASFDWNPTSLRVMFWCALLHENPKMTLEHAGSLLSSFRDIRDVRMLIIDAWRGSTPDADEDSEPGEATAQEPA